MIFMLLLAVLFVARWSSLELYLVMELKQIYSTCVNYPFGERSNRNDLSPNYPRQI